MSRINWLLVILRLATKARDCLLGHSACTVWPLYCIADMENMENLSDMRLNYAADALHGVLSAQSRLIQPQVDHPLAPREYH